MKVEIAFINARFRYVKKINYGLIGVDQDIGTRNSEEWRNRWFSNNKTERRLDTIQTRKSSFVKQRLIADFINASADLIIFIFSHPWKIPYQQH